MGLVVVLRGVAIGDDGRGDPFAEGRTTYTVTFASGKAQHSEYFAVGLGVGHFVAPGLEVGLQAMRWFSGQPSVLRLEPNVRYVAHRLDLQAKPYIGVLLGQWLVDGQDDFTTVGTRIGMIWVRGRYRVTLGGRFEWLTDCYECDLFFAPELELAASF